MEPATYDSKSILSLLLTRSTIPDTATSTTSPSSKATTMTTWATTSPTPSTTTTTFSKMLTKTVSSLFKAAKDTSTSTFLPSSPSLNGSLIYAPASSPGEGFSVDAGTGRDGSPEVNTPLNAPEPSLEPVSDPGLLGTSSTDLKDLAWIIPSIIVIVVAMVGLAFACYYGVRKLEMRMLQWCYRNCGCCCTPGGGEGGRLLRGEQYDTLQESSGSVGRNEAVRLRDFRERSPSYGGARSSSSKAYTPRIHFNPFDEES